MLSRWCLTARSSPHRHVQEHHHDLALSPRYPPWPRAFGSARLSALKRSIARFANACVKLLPRPSGPPASPAPRAASHGGAVAARPGHAAISSPWRIYRIYARPGHLLIRNEQGEIHELGVMKGSEPNLSYRLYAKDLKGQGFASRTQLLDDIARRIETGEVGRELLSLPVNSTPVGVDLDRGSHTDVSMKLAR